MCKSESEIIGYLRILKNGISYQEISFGRVAVKKNYRKKGITKEMMLKAIDFTLNKLNGIKIRISTQTYLIDFYCIFGFKKVSKNKMVKYLRGQGIFMIK